MNVVRLHGARLCAVACFSFFFFLSTLRGPAQALFVGTNAPGAGTNFSFTLPAGATNLCLAITNNSATAWSELYLKHGAGVTETLFDFSSTNSGVVNAVYLELPEAAAGVYSFRVRTPAGSLLHAFRVELTTNRVDLRLPPRAVSKPQIFNATGRIGSNQWHVFRIELNTNSNPGWRMVINSTNTTQTASVYLRRGGDPIDGIV